MVSILAPAKTVEKWKNGLAKCRKPNYTIETPFGKKKLFRDANDLYVFNGDSKVFITVGETDEVKLDYSGRPEWYNDIFEKLANCKANNKTTDSKTDKTFWTLVDL